MFSVAHAFGFVKFEMAGDTLTLALSRSRERGSNDGWLGSVSVNSQCIQSELA